MRRKATGQSNSTTKPITQSSGTSSIPQQHYDTLPQLLPSPYYYNLHDIEASIKNQFMYVIKHYGYNGLSVLIYRKPVDDQVVVMCGQWNGQQIDLALNTAQAKYATDFINLYLSSVIATMRLIRLDQAQLFIANEGKEHVLVDMQLTANKLAGPGMIRDIFSKIIKTQEVRKIEVIDEKTLDAIKNGSGSYEGDLILKPSKFKMYHQMKENIYRPMYAEIKR